jgi:hypothetical protein
MRILDAEILDIGEFTVLRFYLAFWWQGLNIYIVFFMGSSTSGLLAPNRASVRFFKVFMFLPNKITPLAETRSQCVPFNFNCFWLISVFYSKTEMQCEIWDCHSGDYEEYYIPGCWGVSGRSLTNVSKVCTTSIFRVNRQATQETSTMITRHLLFFKPFWTGDASDKCLPVQSFL